MAKARLLGMKTSYIPNSKADMRLRKKVYQKGREIAQRGPGLKEERRIRREKENL